MRPRGSAQARRRTGTPAYAVVMAGGESTRLWPLSRLTRPKHLLAITGKRTLLQETVKRLSPTFSPRRILVVTGAEHEAEVRRQLPRVPRDHILVEPASRNTAACLALAADWLNTHVGDAVMLAAPADHIIPDDAAFRRTIETAVALAASHASLVTIGVRPTRPETGYGYIEYGANVRGFDRGASWVKRFHEKPDATIARRYLRSGRHLWNSGMFAWRVEVFRRALAQCAPRIFAAMDGVHASLRGRESRIRVAYRNVPAQAIDIAVMQPLSVMKKDAVARIAVVRCRFGWMDAGTWDAMGDLWPHDVDGNAVRGGVLAIDSQNSIVYSPQRLVALVGVQGLVVVDGGDAILVGSRDRAQDVRRVAATLRERGWKHYL